MKILCFGELLFDHIEGTYYLGGAPNNFAGHSAKLGAETYLITSVGSDELGERGLREAAEHGVRTDYIEVSKSYPTGVVEVHLENGIPQYEIAFSAWDHISLDEQKIEQLAGETFDILYFGTLAQRTPENARLARMLMEKLSYKDSFYDVNLRQDYYNRELIRDSLKHTSILKLNDEELPIVSELIWNEKLAARACYERLQEEFPVKIMLLTCGKEGAYYYSPEGSGHIATAPVEVVDTVGAGDSFSAGFIRVYTTGEGVEKAVEFASRLADFVVTRQGALPAYNEQILTHLAEIEKD